MSSVNIGNLAGSNGGKYVADTTAQTGTWFAIICIADCAFTALTSNITGLPNNLTLTAGQAVYGTFTAFTLASGSVIAYNKI